MVKFVLKWPNAWQMMTFVNPLDALIPKIPFSFFAAFRVHVTSGAWGSVSVGLGGGGRQLRPVWGRGRVKPEGLYRPPCPCLEMEARPPQSCCVSAATPRRECLCTTSPPASSSRTNSLCPTPSTGSCWTAWSRAARTSWYACVGARLSGRLTLWGGGSEDGWVALSDFPPFWKSAAPPPPPTWGGVSAFSGGWVAELLFYWNGGWVGGWVGGCVSQNPRGPT